VPPKNKSAKLIKAPKGKTLLELKNEYDNATHPAHKKLLFFLIKKIDDKFKG
jgi:hypothetical protein